MDLHYEIQGQGEPVVIDTQEMADNLHIAELFQQVPDIQFARIDGADHVPTLTRSDQLFSLIREFLSEA